MPPSDYPVTFAVEYPERPLSRLSTAFRIILVIPIWIIAGLLAAGSSGADGDATYWAGAGVGLVVLPTVLMILFRQKYPRWWYDWNRELIRFSNRVSIYFALMDDRYPSTDEQQAVHFDMPYPDVPNELNRWLPLVKWLLAIPHYIVLFFLGIAAFFVIIFAWFAILFTGRYPRSAFTFVEGVFRWFNRVIGYAYALTTDRYPPFRLSP